LEWKVAHGVPSNVFDCGGSEEVGAAGAGGCGVVPQAEMKTNDATTTRA
jgi:hypothetical protein